MPVVKREVINSKLLFIKMLQQNGNVRFETIRIFDSTTFSNVYFIVYEGVIGSNGNILMSFSIKRSMREMLERKSKTPFLS